MARPPVLKPRDVIRLLEAFGFEETRQKGSHKRFEHPDGRACTIPVHHGRDLSNGVMRQILKDIDMTGEEFIAGPTNAGED